jgi:polar amino acid transport system substrate-binding protein
VEPGDLSVRPGAQTVGRLWTRAATWLAAPFMVMSAAVAQTAPPDVVKDLAPSGRLRAAINFGNPVLAQKDAATGDPRGVSVDLSRELARRLGVPVELVRYDAAG